MATRTIPRALLMLLLTAPAHAVEPAPAADAPHHYSAFGIEVPAGTWFRHVSLKRVGVRPLGEVFLEALADGIANGLQPALPAILRHDPEWADPRWHTQCQGQHVYIDLWRSLAPDRVGFSLWTGCGAGDLLSRRELNLHGFGLTVDEAARIGGAIAAELAACPAERCG